MSSDNGIYILRTLASTKEPDAFEYRVAECMAIDNIQEPEPAQTEYLRYWFSNSPVFTSVQKAEAYAEELHRNQGNRPTEYGIQSIHLTRTFPQTVPGIPREVNDKLFAEPQNTAVAGFKRFWMVWVEGTSGSSVKHPTPESASAEAERLAMKTKKQVYILETIEAFRPVDQVVKMVPIS